jgi:hypothetical protein
VQLQLPTAPESLQPVNPDMSGELGQVGRGSMTCPAVPSALAPTMHWAGPADDDPIRRRYLKSPCQLPVRRRVRRRTRSVPSQYQRYRRAIYHR